MANLAELRALAKRASPGPWHMESGDYQVWVGDRDGYRPTLMIVPLDDVGPSKRVEAQMLANSEYIQALDPQAVLALLDRLESAEGD